MIALSGMQSAFSRTNWAYRVEIQKSMSRMFEQIVAAFRKGYRLKWKSCRETILFRSNNL